MDPGQFPAFQPHPLLRGGHAQTIFGAYLRSPAPAYTAIRRTVKLQDGDFIVLHDDAPSSGIVVPPDFRRRGEELPDTAAGRVTDAEPPGPPDWRSSDRVVLLLHGLGGSYRSGYMPRLAARLNAEGFRTFRMDLRGWGAGRHVARKTAHAGMSDDVEAALRFIARLCPKSPVTLVGFSLGGNLSLKLAGEAGDRPPAGLDSVVAVAPPIDLVECARNIKQGINWIYDRAFVQSLHRNLRQRSQVVPDDLNLRALPSRLYEFDDQVTAPLNGFEDAEHYYRWSSAGPRLADVRVRTLIITAEDDPLIPAAMFEKFPVSKQVRLHVTRHGGHLGFIGRPGEDPDHRWLDWRLVQAIRQWDRESRALITSATSPVSRPINGRLAAGDAAPSRRPRPGNRPRPV